jgi:hypothetical protein
MAKADLSGNLTSLAGTQGLLHSFEEEWQEAVIRDLAMLRGIVQDIFKGVRAFSVELNGTSSTPVSFTSDVAASITGTAEGPFALANGLTLVVDPDGAGDDTVIFEATAGTSVSAEAPSTDLSGGTDLKFNISVDGDTAEEVTLVAANCNTGENIATEMQTQIRDLGGNKANVTVVYGSGVYTISSGTAGTSSSVVITDASADNAADDLKLGVANGGTETAGTGDAANIAAATAAEVAAAIAEKATGWSAAASGDAVVITSATAGKDSSLVVNATSTADAILGITGSAYGAQGIGYSSGMKDDAYYVLATLQGVAAASLAGTGLSITNKAASGFSIESEDTDSEETVDVLVVGVSA